MDILSVAKEVLKKLEDAAKHNQGQQEGVVLLYNAIVEADKKAREAAVAENSTATESQSTGREL